EAERLPGERADRADVDGVAGVVVVERLAGEGGDDRVPAAVEQSQFTRLAHFVAEADAARALDAALAVEHDARADRLALVVVDFLLDEAALSGPVGDRVLLQAALAGLVADRAVERMVDQEELHDPFARRLHLVGA